MLKLKGNILWTAFLLFGAMGLIGCTSTATSTASNNSNKAVVADTNQTKVTVENIDNKSVNNVVENIDNKSGGNVNNKSDKPVTNNKTEDSAKINKSSEGKIGVPECDDFLEKYEMCLTKIPEAQREDYRKTLETTRIGLKRAVVIPEAKAVLGISCDQSLKTAKETLKGFSCDW